MYAYFWNILFTISFPYSLLAKPELLQNSVGTDLTHFHFFFFSKYFFFWFYLYHTLVSTILPLKVGALFLCNTLEQTKTKEKYLYFYIFSLSCGAAVKFVFLKIFHIRFLASLALHINILLSKLFAQIINDLLWIKKKLVKFFKWDAKKTHLKKRVCLLCVLVFASLAPASCDYDDANGTCGRHDVDRRRLRRRRRRRRWRRRFDCLHLHIWCILLSAAASRGSMT